MTLFALDRSIHTGIFNRFPAESRTRDCSVSSFRLSQHSQAITVKRMKRIANLNVRNICTQGIVRDDGTIPISIA